MADVREVFNILADDTTGAGEAAISRIEGEAAASKQGLIGFSFKDFNGNVVLPQLTPSGAVVVSTEGAAGDCLRGRGILTGTATLTEIPSVSITLTIAKVYSEIAVVVSCLRESLFQIIYIDDAGGTPVETILEEIIVGAGQYTVQTDLHCLELDTTGGTGVQKLTIKAKNFAGAPSALSDMRATLTTLQLP
jgi:hypothetical protein